MQGFRLICCIAHSLEWDAFGLCKASLINHGMVETPRGLTFLFFLSFIMTASQLELPGKGVQRKATLLSVWLGTIYR